MSVACNIYRNGECLMMQQDDKSILINIAKVIAVLIVIMFCLIFAASYIGGGR